MAESQLMKIAIASAGNIQSGRYVTVSVYALAVYEWLITFRDEVDLIHHSPWNSVKVAFLTCRYYPVAFWAIYLWAFVQNHKLELCRHIVKVLYIFMIPFQLSAQAVMVMRAWAFTGRSRIVLWVLLPAYAILVAVEIWVFATDVEAVKPSPIANIIGQTGCFRGRGRGPIETPEKVAITLMAACLVDFLCMSVIIFVSIVFACEVFKDLWEEPFLYKVKQGAGASAIMTGIHVFSATISFRNKSFAGGVVAPIPMILSNVVACRLILSLRRRVSPTETKENRDLSRLIRNDLELSSTIHYESDQWAL